MKIALPISFFLVLAACTQAPKSQEMTAPATWERMDAKTNHLAGKPMVLKFTDPHEHLAPELLLTNAYGTAVLRPEKKVGVLAYHIPPNFYRKSGLCHWKLVWEGKVAASGEFTIDPNTSRPPKLETYFGPRSITVGGADRSMLVAVATDPYDNVFPPGTRVTVKSQYQDTIRESTEQTSNFIAWKNIPTEKTSGRILVSASSLGTTSREMTTLIFPAPPTAFKIDFERNHAYADGNQIVQFRSNSIRDPYGNTVDDGTLVTFLIKNSKGHHLKTMGTTLNGIARASLLHPSEKEEWQVTAYVTGAAKSNMITLSFETAIADYTVRFSKDNRHITIGPLKSFMQQRVPDGIPIQLELFDAKGAFLESKKISSDQGMGSFELPAAYFTAGRYRLLVRTAGITKTYKLELQDHETQ